ncbi:MAG: flagellar export chaperone FliS [Pseudomonadales bacterium]|nr:flagellar export chaperone FliS [Pseudomonadales bacterium]
MPQLGAKQYQKMNVQTSLSDASPHQLITMLFDGLISRLAMAKGFIDRKDYEGKSRCLGSAITIIGALQNSLDKEQGGDIAENLDRLYLYMTRRVFAAGVANDVSILDEVVSLVKTIKDGWDGIKEEAGQRS